MSYKSKLVLALGSVYIIWGSTFMGVRYALDVLPPILVSFLRFFVGGIILSIFILINDKKFPSKKQIINASIIGILLSGIGNSAVAYGIGKMPTGLVALLVATLPAWMIIIDALLFGGKKPSFIASIGLVLGLIGMIYLLNPFQTVGKREVDIFSAILILLGSITWAYGSIRSPHMDMPSSLQSTAIQMLAGGFLAFIMSFFFEENQIQAIRSMTLQTYLAMAYLIFIGSFVGYTAYVWLINNAPTQITATYAYVNPVVAIILGWLILDEKLTPRSITASVIILSGVILMTIGRRK